jgi:hypothetical protein
MVGLVVNNELERMRKEAVIVLHWQLFGGTEVNLNPIFGTISGK